MGHHRSITGNHIRAVDEKTLARHGQARERSGVVRRHRTPGHVFEQGLAQAHQRHRTEHASPHGLVREGIGGLLQLGVALLGALHRQPMGDNFHRQPGSQGGGDQHHGCPPRQPGALRPSTLSSSVATPVPERFTPTAIGSSG